MKAAVLHGVNDLRVENVDKPVPKHDEVLIKIRMAQLSISDVNRYKGLRNSKFPVITGHEFSGSIEDIGKKVKGIEVGDRVVAEPTFFCGKCRACMRGARNFCLNIKRLGVDYDGAFAEYVVCPTENVVILPDTVSYEEGAMAQPLGLCVSSVIKAGIDFRDTVVILGQGPIGLMMMQVAKASGAKRVITTELLDNRLDVSKKLGADLVINAREMNPVNKVLEETDNLGADVVIEAAGSPTTFQQAIRMASSGGKVILAGIQTSSIELPSPIPNLMRTKIIGGLRVPRMMQPAVDLLGSKRVNVNPIITHTLPLEEIMRAYDLLERSRETGAIQIQFKIS